MKKWNMKSILKEVITGALILFILTNIISYVRKPSLDSNQLPHIQAELLDGSQYSVKEGEAFSHPLLGHLVSYV